MVVAIYKKKKETKENKDDCRLKYGIHEHKYVVNSERLNVDK